MQSQSRLRQLPRQQQKFFNCGCCKPFTLCDHCLPSNPTLSGWRVSVSGLIEVPYDSDDYLPGNCDPYPPRTCSYDVSGGEGSFKLLQFGTCNWTYSKVGAFTAHCEGCGLSASDSSYTMVINLSYTTSFPGSPSFPWWASIASSNTSANYRAADADCSGAITLSKYAEAVGVVGVTFPGSLTFTPVS